MSKKKEPRRKVNYKIRIAIFYWLIELIGSSKDGLTFEEIVEEWRKNDDLTEKELSTSTFKDYRDAIQTIFDIHIGCGKGYRKYKILSRGQIDRMQDWMVRSIATSRMLTRYNNLSDRIFLENMPEIDYLDTIMQAMNMGRKLMMLVFDSREGMDKDWLVSPYCMKTYHNRWYLLAKCDKDDQLKMFCLDGRIRNVEIAETSFTMDKNFSADEYFEDYFGVRVNHPDDKDLETKHIVLRAYRDQRYKLKYQPICEYKEVIWYEDEEYADFKFDMKQTYDFVEYLESLGRYIEVIEPLSLREELLRVHQEAIERNKI